MKQEIYKDGDGYILVTGESPKGFKDYLFVIWEGPLDNLTESMRTCDQLKQLEKIDEVPDEWLAAFSSASRLCLDAFRRRTPKPKQKKPVRRAAARRDTAMDEFIIHCAAGIDPITAAVVSGAMDERRPEPEIEYSDSYETFHAALVWVCIAFGFVVLYGFLCL